MTCDLYDRSTSSILFVQQPVHALVAVDYFDIMARLVVVDQLGNWQRIR